MPDTQNPRHSLTQDEAGFTLIELLVSVAILMVISGLMMRGTLDMSRLNIQQSNRSEMHAGIRNATALLQQEVGQAGRMAFPTTVTLDGAVAAGVTTMKVKPSATGMFPGLHLLLDLGSSEEVVTVATVNGTTLTVQVPFNFQHANNATVRPAGGFAAGVIPTAGIDGHAGSSASVLKIVGDVNSDGNLMYVEYTCDWNEGLFYRNMMPYTDLGKPDPSIEQVLLDNLQPNPPNVDGTPADCFTYEERTIDGTTYVINVAIMTTVRTDERDPVTGRFQSVTKALLNVAPRNVFHLWQIASLGYSNRIQPLPPNVVQNLLD